MRYDSIHGRFPLGITVNANSIALGRGPIDVVSTYVHSKMDWSDFYVVMECTGRINNGRDSAAYIKQGAKVVLFSAPAKNINKTVVHNVNDKYLVQTDTIISNSSCTTKCLEPVLKVINDALGINFGMMTTIHSCAGDSQL